MDAAIETYGFYVISVGYGGCSVPGCCGPVDRHPWSYTIGLSQRGLPELVLMGLSPVSAHFALSYVANEALAGRPVPLGDRIELAGAAIKVVEVPEEWVLTDPDRIGQWFEERFRHERTTRLPELRQVLWADAEGAFPDECGCDPSVREQQPVLFEDPFSVPHQYQRDGRRGRHQKRKAS